MPEIIVSIYRKTNVENCISEYVAQTKLNTLNKWQYVFEQLPYQDSNENEYTYYAQEVPVEGYMVDIGASVTMYDGTISIVNRKIDEIGTIAVKKRWEDYFGKPIQDMNLLPDIKTELWRHVTSTVLEPVTLKIVCGNIKNDVRVQRGPNLTFQIKEKYNPIAWAKFSKINKDGIQNSDVEATQKLPDELYEAITLNNDNSWQNTWKKLPITEKKNGCIYSYMYYVKETSNISAYITTYSLENKDGIQGGELQIINRAKTGVGVLPKTGGIGINIYFISGLFVLILAMIGLIYLNLKYKGGE